MNIRYVTSAAVTILLLIVHVSPLNAAWPSGGLLACGESGEQIYPKAVSDGTGGMIAVWRDYRVGFEVYAQRLDGSGTAMWTDGGINLSPGTTGVFLDLVSDDAGGAIVIWGDASTEEIMATRIAPDGTFPWGAGGVIINTDSASSDIVAAEDGSGGVLVAWATGTGYYIQRIDADGVEMWAASGILYTSVDMPNNYDPDLVSDGAGGALIAFMNDDPSLPDVFVQRVYANGSLWSGSGTRVDYTTGLNYASYYPAVALDGAGGAYVAWQREDPGTSISVQKIDPVGVLVFASALRFCTDPDTDEKPDIISDGEGGAYIIWEKELYSSIDIYALRLDAYGISLWESTGVPVCEADNNQFDAVFVTANSGGFIAGWTGEPIGGPGSGNPLFTQKIDIGGVARWAADGAVLLEGEESYGYGFAADGSGGVMVVVSEDREIGTGRDIYAQSFSSFGVPSAPEPDITAVDDVPGDQGGWLRLTIGPSDRDRIDQVSEQVTFYDIWQRVDDPPALSSMAEVSDGGCPPRLDVIMLECDSSRFIVAAPGGVFPSGTWEAVGSFGASQADEYIFRASTLADMVGTAVYYSVYTVTARTENPSVWFVSAPDSGVSVDNLEPEPPMNLAGEQSYSPEGLQLTWDPNTEDDLWYYAVYRGTGGTTTLTMAELVATPQVSEHFDDSWSWDEDYWYILTAVDIHGNESGLTFLTVAQITGDETVKVPDADFLEQNYPNPFNPITTIVYGIQEQGHVSLRIYDAAGRFVVDLIDEYRPAGRYTAAWDVTSHDGTPAASGVYFYRLVIGDFVQTKKMVLLR